MVTRNSVFCYYFTLIPKLSRKPMPSALTYESSTLSCYCIFLHTKPDQSTVQTSDIRNGSGSHNTQKNLSSFSSLFLTINHSFQATFSSLKLPIRHAYAGPSSANLIKIPRTSTTWKTFRRSVTAFRSLRHVSQERPTRAPGDTTRIHSVLNTFFRDASQSVKKRLQREYISGSYHDIYPLRLFTVYLAAADTRRTRTWHRTS